ncbi:hypothetical protein Are01nite_90050 [Actinoplanes regularis]|nr:hypothetical protein Are01nite_90050 [Actinoplanes regularis]
MLRASKRPGQAPPIDIHLWIRSRNTKRTLGGYERMRSVLCRGDPHGLEFLS